MDSIFHATRKILIERATSNQTQTQPQQPELPSVAPPAYSAEPPVYNSNSNCTDDEDLSSDYYSEDDEDTDDPDPSPITLTLNAETTIKGTGNLVAAPALADATRFSALLLAAVQSLNAKAEAEAQLADSDVGASATGRKVRPVLNVRVVLECGVSVVGDRNVVGFRPPLTGVVRQGGVGGDVVVGGLKRKAEEEVEGEVEAEAGEGAVAAKRIKESEERQVTE